MFEDMYEKVGEKIKLIAKIICIIGVIGSVIYGIYMLTLGSEFFFSGLLIAVVGSLGSWISSLFTYGFGVIISNTEAIKQNTEDTSKTALEIVNCGSEKEKSGNTATKVGENDFIVKTDEHVAFKCPSCKAALSYSKEYISKKSETICPMCGEKINLENEKHS